MKVYITKNTHTRPETYHTREDCPYLKQADSITTKDKQYLNERREQCKWCAKGYVRKGRTEWHEINDLLKDENTTL